MFKRHTVKLLLIGLSLGLLASASELTKSNVDDEQEASSVIKLVDKDGALYNCFFPIFIIIEMRKADTKCTL